MRVVPAFGPREDRHAHLRLTLEVSTIDDFALEGGEEPFEHGVVVRVGRARRRHNAGFATALDKSATRVLTTLDALMFVKRQ